MNDFHFAVVVGIDFYPGIRDLKAARGDADKFAAWLLDPAGGALPPANVQVIQGVGPFTLPDDALPTRIAVDRAFRSAHMAARAAFSGAGVLNWKSSRLYVYFAGHGLAPGPFEVACLMANATLTQPGENFGCQKYLDYYATSGDFREIVFFTDCCRGESAGAPISGPPFMPVRGNNGVVVCAAGFATQYKYLAYEESVPGDEDRGFYTTALIEGLRGSGADSNGEINTTSLQNYLRARVQDMTATMRNPQTPTMQADAAAPIVFGTVAAAPRHSVAFDFPAGFNGTVLLLNGNNHQVDTHMADGTPWTVQLADGLYELQPAPGISADFKNQGLFRVIGKDLHVQL